MISPSRDDFRALARRYTVIPVWRELLADFVTPVGAFARLCAGDEAGFLLELHQDAVVHHLDRQLVAPALFGHGSDRTAPTS